MHAQSHAELVLPRQAQLHQLGGGDAPPHRIVLGMHEQRHTGGEIGDLPVLAYDGHDAVDLLGATRQRGQVVLCRHPENLSL
jgi:hypothetical protein